MSELAFQLNERQQEAVEIINGPVIVFAGAGTGKTRTLTQRVAFMVEQGIRPNNILAITFTNKATNEMKERLEKFIGSDFAHLSVAESNDTMIAECVNSNAGERRINAVG